MRKILIILISLPIFIASSCDKDPEMEVVGDVEIIFRANYDGELFLTQKDYEYIPDMSIKFSTFDLYVSNISLLKEESSTDESELVEIDFVDLSFDINQQSRAEEGDTVFTKKVPAGSYKGFKIGFGVPADLNRTSPNDYGSGDVLATSSHYWAPLDSYIFSKIEGFVDKDNDGIYETSEGEGFTFHLGRDEVYTERIIFPSDPIVVEDGQKLEIYIDIDIKKLFNMPIDQFDTNDDNLLDIEVYDGAHGNQEEELIIAKQLMRNYSEATLLEQ